MTSKERIDFNFKLALTLQGLAKDLIRETKIDTLLLTQEELDESQNMGT